MFDPGGGWYRTGDAFCEYTELGVRRLFGVIASVSVCVAERAARLLAPTPCFAHVPQASWPSYLASTKALPRCVCSHHH